MVATIEAGKEIFVTKEDFNELKNFFHELQVAVDKFGTKVSKHDEELIIMNYRLGNLEKTNNK